ncbi:unnamed protein product [Trypanosoma congolense IL3000]|uniref:WGS project CAEQ00000000 data, annotated contig 32 n=1 Tax=Trypanosoma congolense (strain IL3000) TaxID=1068625 RepID=F9WEX5_TRYCI|nr:unnamed protein product [Trypanosoma congolense IL3000]
MGEELELHRNLSREWGLWGRRPTETFLGKPIGDTGVIEWRSRDVGGGSCGERKVPWKRFVLVCLFPAVKGVVEGVRPGGVDGLLVWASGSWVGHTKTQGRDFPGTPHGSDTRRPAKLGHIFTRVCHPHRRVTTGCLAHSPVPKAPIRLPTERSLVARQYKSLHHPVWRKFRWTL